MKAQMTVLRMLLNLSFIGAICAPLYPNSSLAIAQSAMPNEVMHGFGLNLDIAGLEDLGEGWAYEGWLIVDDAPVSAGVFTVDTDGNFSTDIFAVSNRDMHNYLRSIPKYIEVEGA